MSNALAVRTASLPEKIAYAKAMADSNLLPAHYRRQPANLLIALEYAEAFGIPPISAVSGVYVIDGKPSASADLIAAMVRRAGHKLRVTGDDTEATAVIIRADDPDFEYTATWDLDKARQAGLLGKGTWKQYPAALLRARAITEVARMGASDALFGVIYTPEEIGAEVDPDGAPILGVTGVPEHSGRDWDAEIDALTDLDALRGLWQECKAWGELTQDVDVHFTARASQLTAEADSDTPADDVVDAVEVDENQGELFAEDGAA